MPFTNAQIAALFDDLADVLEIKKERWFKVRAYRRAAEVIRGFSETLEGLVQEGRDLKAIPGIGEAIAAKTAELVTTGRVATYEREKGSLPETFRILVDLPGFGPKLAWRVVQETGAETLEELGSALAGRPPTWLPIAGEGSVEAVLERLADRVYQAG
jgi:DNA polymerase (family 10)